MVLAEHAAVMMRPSVAGRRRYGGRGGGTHHSCGQSRGKHRTSNRSEFHDDLPLFTLESYENAVAPPRVPACSSQGWHHYRRHVARPNHDEQGKNVTSALPASITV